MKDSNGKLRYMVYEGDSSMTWERDLTPGFIYPYTVDDKDGVIILTDDAGDIVNVNVIRIHKFAFYTIEDEQKLLRFNGDTDDEWAEDLTVGKIYVVTNGYLTDDIFDEVFLFGDRFNAFEEVTV